MGRSGLLSRSFLLILSVDLEGGALGAAAAGGSAVAAANLNLIQAAVVLGIVVGTAAHTALDVAVHIVLIHGLRPSFIVDGLSMAPKNLYMHLYAKNLVAFLFIQF